MRSGVCLVKGFAYSLTALLLLFAVGCGRAPRQTEWVEERFAALGEIYNLSGEGREWLASLDLRQKIGRPAWFATYAGGRIEVGQAIPESIMHEIGHAYWVSFFTSDNPRGAPGGGSLPALGQYRQALITFMSQPPDRYEPLRERFRNLPNLSSGDYPDLFHFGEADMVTMVGGNLNLVPPILRPYFKRFIQPGGTNSWQEAIAWYRGLPPEEVRIADAYFGLTHIGMKRYEYVKAQKSSFVPKEVAKTLENEERQRLLDFALQFEELVKDESSLVDAVGARRGFPFWRGYLREMFQLYKRYPGVLREKASGEHGPKIARAFDAFKKAEGLSRGERPDFLRRALTEDPFLNNFIPILDNRLLVELFRPGLLQAGGLGSITGEFVERLQEYIAQTDSILALGREEPSKGARVLEEYIDQLPKERKQDLDIVLEIFADTDAKTTREIVGGLSEDAILRLLEVVPARVRTVLGPEKLLQVLRITADASPSELADGISKLLRHTSGNYEVEEQFLEEVYNVLARRGARSPAETLEIVEVTSLPLPAFILGYPMAAIQILSSDMEKTIDIITSGEGYRTPPVRFIYHLIYADPVFTASVARGLSKRGADGIVEESLIYFAYDFERLEANPSLPISLRNDGIYMEVLAREMGEEWLKDRLRMAVGRYESDVQLGKVEPDFLDAYRRTWQAIIDQEQEPGARALLERLRASALERP